MTSIEEIKQNLNEKLVEICESNTDLSLIDAEKRTELLSKYLEFVGLMHESVDLIDSYTSPRSFEDIEEIYMGYIEDASHLFEYNQNLKSGLMRLSEFEAFKLLWACYRFTVIGLIVLNIDIKEYIKKAEPKDTTILEQKICDSIQIIEGMNPIEFENLEIDEWNKLLLAIRELTYILIEEYYREKGYTIDPIKRTVLMRRCSWDSYTSLDNSSKWIRDGQCRGKRRDRIKPLERWEVLEVRDGIHPHEIRVEDYNINDDEKQKLNRIFSALQKIETILNHDDSDFSKPEAYSVFKESDEFIEWVIKYIHIHSENSFFNTQLFLSVVSMVENSTLSVDSRYKSLLNEKTDYLENLINARSDEINEKLDSVIDALNDISEKISDYQSLVQKQLELAITEEEVDRIIHAYSEECVQKIINAVDGKYSDIALKEEKEKLITSFGRQLWDKKLDKRSKEFLITAKITYNYYVNIHFVDYSGVCLLVTKALEEEMKRRFYYDYVKYIKKRWNGLDEWRNHLDEFPSVLVYTDRNGNRYLSSQEYFTLGSVPYALCAELNDRAAIEHDKEMLVEYVKSELMKEKEDLEILSILKNYGRRVDEIRENYRNKAAHTNALGRMDAEKCFEIVVDTEKLLKKMLDSFDK